MYCRIYEDFCFFAVKVLFVRFYQNKTAVKKDISPSLMVIFTKISAA